MMNEAFNLLLFTTCESYPFSSHSEFPALVTNTTKVSGVRLITSDCVLVGLSDSGWPVRVWFACQILVCLSAYGIFHCCHNREHVQVVTKEIRGY